jgi:hypothetical protein
MCDEYSGWETIGLRLLFEVSKGFGVAAFVEAGSVDEVPT